MDIEGFRKAGYAAVDSICDYYYSLNKRTVKAEVQPGFLVENLPSQAPDKGEEFTKIAKDFQDLIIPGMTHWQHGKFFAYFPSISTFESMLGELYAASVSNPGFSWVCSPACTELEQVTMDWCAQLLGLSQDFHVSSKKGGGIIMATASESALTAAMAARERALQVLAKQHAAESSESNGDGSETPKPPGSDVPNHIREKYGQKLVMYGSTQTHSLGVKAARLLGLQWRAVEVSEKDDYALRGDALRAAIDADSAKGYYPFFVVATVGTTSTGAVDHVAEIGQVVKDYPTAFLHVDAAWAGVAYALPEQRDRLKLAEVNQYADSFCTNLHKWGLVGMDCSLFFIRDRRDLVDAFDVTPAFLRSAQYDAGTVIDYRNWQIALGRRFRSVKTWFVLRSYGVEGFQRHLQTGIDQGRQLVEIVTSSRIFEVVTPPSLSLVVFRLITPDHSSKPLSDPELNLLTQKLHNRLDSRSDVFLTPSTLHSLEGEKKVIRIALGGANTTMKDVEEVWAVIEQEGEEVLRQWEEEKRELEQ